MNFYSLCVLGLVGIIGISDVAQATSSCATVDANLNASLPCVAVKDSFYQVTLNYKASPNDPSQPLWSLGSYTVTTDNGSCSTASSFYNLTIPCVSVDGNDYKVELGLNDNQDNPIHFEWSLGTVELIGATGTPKFDGVIFSTANNINQVTIAWLDATDDKTPASEIKYNIYVSDIPTFTPSASNFSHSVTGVKQTVISGLAAGKTYYIRVIAVDSDGLMSSGEKYATVTTLLNPVVLSNTVPLFVAEKNDLATPNIVGSDYRFPYTGTETLPAKDSIIVGTDASGGYLRKVV
ncbi:MAG: fibronectin type III domain-containing protein [Proteobacteria bacterium]|nr:fibronectin type III domain-containing protein [Pseudomonadota bacterium]